MIFVDDNSPDGTPDKVRDIARMDPRVRCLQRSGRRGLSSACVEGMLASSAPIVAVMDADLQHDEKLLSPMLAALRQESLDIVVGSRYVEGRQCQGNGTSHVRSSAVLLLNSAAWFSRRT